MLNFIGNKPLTVGLSCFPIFLLFVSHRLFPLSLVSDSSLFCNVSAFVCICFCLFVILSSGFVLQCSGGVPVFCLV